MAATIKIQGDQIEINDIATERTQQQVLKALGGQSKSLNNLAGSSSSASDNVASLGGWAKKGGEMLFGALAGTTKSIAEFGLAAFDQQARISSATGALAKNFGQFGQLLGGPLNSLIQVGEEYTDTLRDLSKSGAGFSNDILAMKNAAGQARLSLDDFAYMVKDSSIDLASVGGSVTQGAKAFSTFSKTFFDGNKIAAESLMQMGMSTNDINDALLLQMKINKRSNFEDAATRDAVAKSAIDLSTEMDTLAKLTGKQKKSIEEEMMASLRKGQVEARFREIGMIQGPEAEREARAAYAKAYTSAQQAGTDAAAAFEELFVQGTVRGEQAKRGMIALGSSANEMIQMAASVRQGQDATTEAMANFDAALIERVSSPEFISTAKLASAGNEVGEAAAGVMSAGAGTLASTAQRIRAEAEFANATTKEVLTEARRRIKLEQEGYTRTTDEQGNEVLTRTGGTELTTTVNLAELAIKDLGAVINDNLLGPTGPIEEFGQGLGFLNDEIRNISRADMDKVVEESISAIKETLGFVEAKPVSEEEQKIRTDFVDTLDQKFTELNAILQDPTKSQAEKDQANELRNLIIEFDAIASTLSANDPTFLTDALDIWKNSYNGDIEQMMRASSELAKEKNQSMADFFYDQQRQFLIDSGQDPDTVIGKKSLYDKTVQAQIEALKPQQSLTQAMLNPKVLQAGLIKTTDIVGSDNKSLFTGQQKNPIEYLLEGLTPDFMKTQPTPTETENVIPPQSSLNTFDTSLLSYANSLNDQTKKVSNNSRSFDEALGSYQSSLKDQTSNVRTMSQQTLQDQSAESQLRLSGLQENIMAEQTARNAALAQLDFGIEKNTLAENKTNRNVVVQPVTAKPEQRNNVPEVKLDKLEERIASLDQTIANYNINAMKYQQQKTTTIESGGTRTSVLNSDPLILEQLNKIATSSERTESLMKKLVRV